MIHLNFNIRNPYTHFVKNLKHGHGALPFKNKFWELEIYRSSDIVRLGFEFTYRESHAGLKFEIGLLSYTIVLFLYDNRHWDTETNTWTKPQLGE